MNDETTKARELPASERASKRWSQTSRNVAIIFSEYPDRSFSAEEIYDIIRTWHLNTKGSKYSESAIRAVLMRFTERGYLNSVRTGAKNLRILYRATEKGFETFKAFSESQEKGSSLTNGERRRVPSVTSSHVHEVEVALKPWREIIGFDSGWKENTRITKVWLDPFIIQNLRSVIPGPSTTLTEWLTVRGEHFTLQVSKKKTIQLWVKGPEWRDELKKWLESVPNLQEHHLDVLWNKVEERARSIVTTREFHLTDPEIARSGEHLFRTGGLRGRTTQDKYHDSEVPRRGGGRDQRAAPGCGQYLHEPGWALCKWSNIHAPLRTHSGKHEGPHAPGIHEEVQGARGLLRGETQRTQEEGPQFAAAGGIC